MNLFVLQVALSFIIGGSYAATLIWISEKFGTKIGGILTGIPTTVLIGLTFIAVTGGDSSARTAALVIPAMAGASLLLVYCYTRFLALGAELSLLLSTAIWFCLALLFVHLKLSNLLINIVIGVLLITASGIAMRKYPRNLKAQSSVLRGTYAMRIVGAGSVIACAVIVARISGSVWGGVVSAFPATFVTTLYVLSKVQGPDFARAVARQLPLANGSTMSFAIIFYLLIIPVGLLISVVIGILGSLAYAFGLLKLSTSPVAKSKPI